MNYSSFNGCQCPTGHPPCSFCTDTYECDKCGDRYDTDDIITFKGQYLCNRCVPHLVEVSRDEYMEVVKNLKVFSSFSDPDGTSPYGNNRPQMITDWGMEGDNLELCACHMTKKTRHDEDWNYKYLVRK